MKKSLNFIFFAALGIFLACSSGKQSAMDAASGRFYGEKSGIITYKPIDMMGVKVTQVVYFDDYGYKEAREISTSGNMMSMEVNSKSMSVREGNIAYYFELENMQNGQNIVKKEAYKSVIPAQMMQEMDMMNLTDEFRKKHDYKEEGKESVLGYEGTKYSLTAEETGQPGRISGVHYKNIPLKLSIGNMQMIAEKIEFNVKIPAEKFKIPADYQIIEESDSTMTDESEPADTTYDPE